jgi:hypothetical protein
MKTTGIGYLLEEIKKIDGERISLNQLVINSDNKYLLLFFIAILSMIPTPAPVSIIACFFGLLGSVFCWQILWGRKTMILPKFLKDISISKKTIDAVIDKITPLFNKIDNISRKRQSYLFREIMQTPLHIVLLMLYLTVVVPLPLIGLLPSMAVILVLFGILNEDGLFVLLGLALGLVAIWVTFKMVVLSKTLWKWIF